jgi:hypothetical protein
MLVWVALPVTLSEFDHRGFLNPTGPKKRGFVVRRTGPYLLGEAYHDLRWYRAHMKRHRMA